MYVLANGIGCLYEKPFMSPFDQHPLAVIEMFKLNRNLTVREFMYKLSEHMPRWMSPGPGDRTSYKEWKLFVKNISINRHMPPTTTFKEIAHELSILHIPDIVLSNSKTALFVSMTPH